MTGVCTTRNLDTVRSLGADQVIDYTREDFAQTVQRYDVMLDRGQRTPAVRDRTGSDQGAFAEYAFAADSNLLPKPANLTSEQSAAVGDSALTALAAVRDQGNVQPGDKVLINGAFGRHLLRQENLGRDGRLRCSALVRGQRSRACASGSTRSGGRVRPSGSR